MLRVLPASQTSNPPIAPVRSAQWVGSMEQTGPGEERSVCSLHSVRDKLGGFLGGFHASPDRSDRE